MIINISTTFFVSLSIAVVHSSISPDCTNVADGLYPIGSCEPRFMTCSSGIARIMDCPDDLVYHKSLQFCDWRHNIFACGRAEKTSSESSGDTSGDESGDGSGTEDELGSGENSGESSGDELLQNVCENLVDGVYSSSLCTNYYFICSSNTPRFLSCPTPLFYDPVQQKCSWKDAVEECREETTATTTTTKEWVSNDEKYEEKKGSSNGSTESCEDKVDGIYSINECSDIFLTCSDGITHIMDCPSNLYFHSSLLICDQKQNIVGCTGPPTPKPECEEDGYFSFGRCSSTFTGCTNRRAIVMFCPSGLKFSQKTQMCDYERNVLECERFGEKSPGNEGYQEETNNDLLTPCTHMENGLYALDCTPRVLSCQNGIEEIFECPSSLVFNEQSLTCDFPETSLKCRVEDTLLIRDSAISTYDCAVDGLFSNALCSRDYHRCLDGQLIKHECADANAVFSMTEGQCVDASTLDQCQ